MRLLVTGGAGFIGANFVHGAVRDRPNVEVTVLDAMNYAGSAESLNSLAGRIRLVDGDITDESLIADLVAKSDAVVHFAAETHVDNSLADPAPFLRSNIVGTFSVLEAVRRHGVRLHHISTDEVYGSMAEGQSASEALPLAPSSPYAASKAAGDLLVLAAVRSWGLDAVITRSCNNLGPRQHPEKLIPLMIAHALQGWDLPVYGSGLNVRDWVLVHDNCEGLLRAALMGRQGRVYNLGAGQERDNLQVVRGVLAQIGADPALIRRVADRPGHDWRYSLDSRRALDELGWSATVPFEPALEQTVRWYLEHRSWWEPLLPEEAP